MFDCCTWRNPGCPSFIKYYRTPTKEPTPQHLHPAGCRRRGYVKGEDANDAGEKDAGATCADAKVPIPNSPQMLERC